jgi:hypothetical protein
MDKRNESSLLQTIFGMMIFFSGMLYVTNGPATKPAVFWYRLGLLIIGLVGLGVLYWRKRAAGSSGK